MSDAERYDAAIAGSAVYEGHRTLAGNVEKRTLNAGERLIATLVRALEGDVWKSVPVSEKRDDADLSFG